MGAFRDSWQKAKKAMEAEPKFGKDWGSKTFRDDLGPDLDKLEAMLNEEMTIANQIDLLAQKLQDLRTEATSTASKAFGKVDAYKKSVEARAKEGKLSATNFTSALSTPTRLFVSVQEKVEVKVGEANGRINLAAKQRGYGKQ